MNDTSVPELKWFLYCDISYIHSAHSRSSFL